MNRSVVRFSPISAAKKNLELTLAILKPDVCKNPTVNELIKKVMVDEGFHFVRSLETHLSLERAKLFYKEHESKFFYNRLITFISSGTIHVHVIARENGISHWRRLLGPTRVYKTQYEDPDSIRGKYGLTDTRNAGHGSDSVETATEEIQFFFPDFNATTWKTGMS